MADARPATKKPALTHAKVGFFEARYMHYGAGENVHMCERIITEKE
jgi:hypothetical protein